MLVATRRIIYFMVWLYACSVIANESQDASSQELAGEQFMVANTLWTLLHETAHVVIDELDIPVIASEEDVADQLATIALLGHNPNFDLPDSVTQIESVIAAATAWRVEWELEQWEGAEVAYWDSHSLSIQRFYHMMCLLYGNDPDKYEAVQEQLGLPYEHVLGCVDAEYERAHRAVKWIIDTYGRQQDSAAPHGNVSVVYEKPLTDEHKKIAATINKAGIAELVAKHVEGTLAMPNDITIVFTSCFSGATAFWHSERKEIVMCYELLARFLYLYKAKQCLEMKGVTDEKIEACLARTQN